MNNAFVKRWMQLLSNSETETVINELAELYPKREIIILKSRWKELNAQRTKGVISYSNFELERNKINDALVDIIESVENGALFNSAMSKQNSISKAGVMSIIGIAIVLSIGIGYFLGGEGKLLSRENPPPSETMLSISKAAVDEKQSADEGLLADKKQLVDEEPPVKRVSKSRESADDRIQQSEHSSSISQTPSKYIPKPSNSISKEDVKPIIHEHLEYNRGITNYIGELIITESIPEPGSSNMFTVKGSFLHKGFWSNVEKPFVAKVEKRANRYVVERLCYYKYLSLVDKFDLKCTNGKSTVSPNPDLPDPI
jgi:hypothetical protein